MSSQSPHGVHGNLWVSVKCSNSFIVDALICDDIANGEVEGNCNINKNFEDVNEFFW